MKNNKSYLDIEADDNRIGDVIMSRVDINFLDWMPLDSGSIEKVATIDDDVYIALKMFNNSKRKTLNIYLYYDVSPEDCNGLVNDQSAGTYFQDHIRDKYEYSHILIN